MKYLNIFSTCLVALALHSAAWAQIYETKDAEGNPEFTDSPATEDTEVVDLQETNLADAPQPEPQAESQPGTVATEQAPVQENNTVIINDGNDNDAYDDGYNDDYDGALARERALERGDPAVPREVGDSAAQMPREVGDSEAQMPHEVGDFPEETGARRR